MIGKHVADSKAVSHINHNMIINDSLQTLADWFFWYCSPIRLHHPPDVLSSKPVAIAWYSNGNFFITSSNHNLIIGGTLNSMKRLLTIRRIGIIDRRKENGRKRWVGVAEGLFPALFFEGGPAYSKGCLE